MTNRRELTNTAAHEVALDCLLADIEAAHPRTVVASRVGLEEDGLTIDGETFDRSDFDRDLLLGGGNAAGHVVALSEYIGDFLDGGVEVTDDPVSLSEIGCIVGSHPVPDQRAVEGADRVLA